MTKIQEVKDKAMKTDITEAKKPRTVFDHLRSPEMIRDFQLALGNAMPPEKFSRLCITAIKKTPKLGICYIDSLFGAFMLAAQIGLEPNTPLGEAYIIPYGKQASFQIGYKGLKKLFFNSRLAKGASSTHVHEHDVFVEMDAGERKCILIKFHMIDSYLEALDDLIIEITDLQEKMLYVMAKKKMIKVRAIKPKDHGKIIGVVAQASLTNGLHDHEFMTVEEIITHAKKYSKSYEKKDGPWQMHTNSMLLIPPFKKVINRMPLESNVTESIQKSEKPAAEILPPDEDIQDAEIIDEKDFPAAEETPESEKETKKETKKETPAAKNKSAPKNQLTEEEQNESRPKLLRTLEVLSSKQLIEGDNYKLLYQKISDYRTGSEHDLIQLFLEAVERAGDRVGLNKMTVEYYNMLLIELLKFKKQIITEAIKGLKKAKDGDDK